ncbi:hypothetical protein RRG08_022770 [Elysia crispata]|uniref:Uncharacterized protein n=1 Tax=Elysia crispata TaxID=231223 RepID=A0AAE0ZXV1_9GAST|nr:hypothetical protein RRG08_022770 [Elysia crispata]
MNIPSGIKAWKILARGPSFETPGAKASFQRASVWPPRKSRSNREISWIFSCPGKCISNRPGRQFHDGMTVRGFCRTVPHLKPLQAPEPSRVV